MGKFSESLRLQQPESGRFIKEDGTYTNIADKLTDDKEGIYFKTADNGNIDSFNRFRISNPVTIFDSTHQYEVNSLIWDDGLSTNGTVTHVPEKSAAKLSTGSGTSGDSAILTTKTYHHYQPGKSQLVLMSAVLGTPKDGVAKRIGYYDDSNGLFFQDKNGVLSTVIRSGTSGSAVDSVVPQSEWNIDKMDGTGRSGITLDPSKANIFLVDFEWLSVGRVRFGFVIDGLIYYCHNFLNANSLDTPYSSTANLPLRVEIINHEETNGSTDMLQICSSVISEGGVENERSLIFSASNGITTRTATTSGIPAISVRPKLLYNSIENRT